MSKTKAKKKLSSITLILVMTFILGMIPMTALAKEPTGVPENQAATNTFAGKFSETENIPVDGLADSDELLQQYIEKQAFGESYVQGQSDGRIGIKASRESMLKNETDRNACKALKVGADYIASGRADKAVVEITFDAIYSEDELTKRYTAADLDVTSIIEGGKVSPEAEAALSGKFDLTTKDIVYALLDDCPYDLYWFDKTYALDANRDFSYEANDNEIWVDLDEEAQFTFYFAVSENFAASPSQTHEFYKKDVKEARPIETDSDKITAASGVVAEAQRVVAANESKSDYEKMVEYKKYICDAVAYNDDAMEDEDLPYGNPWQLIWVFDNDSSTDVVCEGYSKAFKFLCDLTDFADKSIDCYLIDGTTDAGQGEGAHMWNIVTIDGKNYLVDVTNCDGEDSIGYPDELFLRGKENADDSVANGYSFTIKGNTIKYTYDKQATDMFTTEELTLADSVYDPSVITRVDVTLEAPKCGVTTSYEGTDAFKTQINPPKIDIPKGATFKGVETDPLFAIWTEEPRDMEGTPWQGKFNGGDTYYVEILLAPKETYSFAPEDDAVEAYVNGVKVDKAIVYNSAGNLLFFAPVTAVHDLEAKSEVKPTCSKAGTKAYYECKGCEKLFSDAEGKTEINEPEEIPIDPNAHVWGDWTVTKEATATADGVETRTCSGCGKKETRAIPKKSNPSKDPNKKGSDGTAYGPGASAAAVDKAITSLASDSDPKGTKYAPLQLKSTKQAKTNITAKWTKVSGATKYVLYGNKCGKKNKMKKIGEFGGTSKKVTKVAGKKLKKGTYYKFIVVALDKNNMVVSTSKIIHVTTKGGKYNNPKKVTTKKPKALKKGKSFKLAGKQSGKKIKKHRKLSYESTNTKVATVSGKGVIKAKGKGTCYVYAYAQNGVSKKIKINVK